MLEVVQKSLMYIDTVLHLCHFIIRNQIYGVNIKCVLTRIIYVSGI